LNHVHEDVRRWDNARKQGTLGVLVQFVAKIFNADYLTVFMKLGAAAVPVNLAARKFLCGDTYAAVVDDNRSPKIKIGMRAEGTFR
jgi:hypothetical protein